MSTCFVFTEQLDEEQCLCLRLDQQGQVDAPLALRPIHELKTLQQNARTMVVLPTARSSLHTIELPWLGESKARAAIPYALEEDVAQSVTTLHFAFDREHYKQNRYLVVVSDKQFLMDLIAQLDALSIDFDTITLDWFALQEDEACVTEKDLLINDNLFKGSLSGDLIPLYLSNQERSSPLLVFNDSLPSLQNVNLTPVDSVFSVWVAQRLLLANKMNLCQGELQHGTHQHTSKQWYWASAILAGVLITSMLLFKAIYLYLLTTNIATLDTKIAVIYREFFPGAQFVVSPKFRIGQLLSTANSANSGASSLWNLLDKFAQAAKGNQFTVEQFHYQRKVLSVTLVSKDFAALEGLQLRLKQSNVKVTQVQATSHDHQVLATLELQ